MPRWSPTEAALLQRFCNDDHAAATLSCDAGIMVGSKMLPIGKKALAAREENARRPALASRIRAIHSRIRRCPGSYRSAARPIAKIVSHANGAKKFLLKLIFV